MEFSEALRRGAIQIPRELFLILDEMFDVRKPLASGLAVARNLDAGEIEELVRERSYVFHDTRYVLVDSLDVSDTILWMKTVYVYTGRENLAIKHVAKPTVIDPMPCRRLYGDPIALDELVVCTALRPLIGKSIQFRKFVFRARKRIIDVDVEGLCRGITSYARRSGGVTIHLPIILRNNVNNIVGTLQARGIDPEFLRSGDIEPLEDLINTLINESKEITSTLG